MIFSIRNLEFELASLLLEGWAAFAARCVCALLILLVGRAVRGWVCGRLLPKLLGREWKLAPIPILLRSFQKPVERVIRFTALYFALASLPWAIAGIPAFLKILYGVAVTFCVTEGFYRASELPALLLTHCGEEIRTNRTLLTLLDKVYKVLVVVLGVATMAQESGLPIGSVLASAGLVGLTISLAAQDIAKNFFSGVVILLDRPFSVGDWIVVGGVEGEVVDINLRSTKVRTLDNTVYILTNSSVSEATIGNASQRTRRLYSLTLSVACGTPRDELERLMADLTAKLQASEHTWEDTVSVKVSGFSASGITLAVSAYVRTADTGTFLQMQNDLTLLVMDVVNADHVQLPMPATKVQLAQ